MISVDSLQAAFWQAYGDNRLPVQCFFSPGRINLIGEHIDYNGGYVFPAALTLGIYSAIRPRLDDRIVLKSANAAQTVIVETGKPICNVAGDGWANYPKGVIKYLLQNGHTLKGYDIFFTADLPAGTGLSSSAALLVLTAYMLRTAAGESAVDRVQLAQFCQRVENKFIGVNCGIMDQFSVALGREDCAILLDCRTLAYQYIPFVLNHYGLVILNTNKKRELAESKYNERRNECEQALAIIQKHKNISNLCQATLDDVETHVKDTVLRRRARHVVGENNRVHMAVKLLTQGNISGFAELMTQSHRSLQADYEVTGQELDVIVDSALQAPGCIGARMTGAGFGGCAIALVEQNRLADFKAAVAARYQAGTGLAAAFYAAGIAAGVSLLAGQR